jgi:hypothetical protein
MELLTPGVGLILWLIIILLVMLPAIVVALVHLMRRQIPIMDKTLWILLIVCLPCIGMVVYFITYYTIDRVQRQ